MWRLRPGPGRGSAPRLRAASGGPAGPGCGPCTILARLSAPLGLGQWPLSMPTGLPATQVWCHVTTSPCLRGKCHDSGTRPQPPPAAGWVAPHAGACAARGLGRALITRMQQTGAVFRHSQPPPGPRSSSEPRAGPGGMGTPRLWGPICTQGPWRSPSLPPRGLEPPERGCPRGC